MASPQSISRARRLQSWNHSRLSRTQKKNQVETNAVEKEVEQLNSSVLEHQSSISELQQQLNSTKGQLALTIEVIVCFFSVYKVCCVIEGALN